MFIQIVLGSALMFVSIMIAGFSFWFLEVALSRWQLWLRRRPHRPKLVFMLCLSALWILVQVTAGVWIWAAALFWLDVFTTFEESVYFGFVAFTTLGFGDILLPLQWRLLGGMAAANGLLNFGLLTAVIVETLRQVRRMQRDATQDDIE
ncbi:two pore domain potassium channel family protein [Octadecabacter sp. SW4]|uniref:ion channel n=1 Tax=Octadecabacter sp. SW4 TaxID=2602067 RepID=UPI0011C1F9DE|nr:ion channel [Octadecabacter sp. SW4]QEE34365.1 two pore domain potassium channel family protein [Octadecabacter sp. SW4]|tara:strand:+ start:1110 stop:1556 length:447 start_codon:yes stop_codon:yes gene_type:complete